MAKPQLAMERASLDGLSEVVVPAGCRIRPYRPGDAAAWCGLVNEAIGGDYTEQRFQTEMAKALGFEPADLFFAQAGVDAVGTAWALRAKHAPENAGCLHMLAVASKHRGRGLGRALVLSVLHRFRELGLQRAVLQTDDFRLAAISVYLHLGFRPKLVHDSHQARWRDVYDKLGLEEDLAQQSIAG
jgi:mycothiol synthase